MSKQNILALLLVSVLGLSIRVLQFYNYQLYFVTTYGADFFVDRIGESYHRWVIDILTMRNFGVFTDYAQSPNQTAVWPPLYNYVSIIMMLLLNDRTILAPRLVSLIAGAATVPMVYLTCREIYGGIWRPLIGAAIAASLPWHVDFSVLGTPHALIGLLTTIAVYFYLRSSLPAFAFFSSLAILSGYEAFFVVILLLLYARFFRGWKGPNFRLAYVPIAVAAVWTVFTIAASGNPLGWLGQYLRTIGWAPTFNLAAAGFYVVETLRVTFFIFLLAVAFGLYHNAKSRIVAFTIGCFVLAASFARITALDNGDVARLVPVYPLMAIAFVPTLPKLGSKRTRQAILIAALVILMIVPHVAQAQIETGPKKAFIQMPEYRTGLALKEAYTGGKVLADGPTAMYYSGIDLSMFISFKDLQWYQQNPDDAKLAAWLRTNDVRWMIWENASFSDAHVIFPSLAEAKEHSVGDVRIMSVYEDTLEKRRELQKQGLEELWEHEPEFGGTTPEVVLYKIELGQQQTSSPVLNWPDPFLLSLLPLAARAAMEFKVV